MDVLRILNILSTWRRLDLTVFTCSPSASDLGLFIEVNPIILDSGFMARFVEGILCHISAK